MKCFIFFVVAFVVAVQAEVTISESNLEPVKDDLAVGASEKKQEKRGIGYNSLGGYSSTSGLGVDGTLGYYNGGVGVGGYNGGYYSPYTPPRVAGLGSISGYTNPGYYSSGYNSAYNTGYAGYGGYAGVGYPGAYNSRLASPYYRQGYYNSYPSSYFNSNLGSSIVGGGLGLAGVPPTVPVVGAAGYQYGPGVSGGIY